jgi:hypothetical protein
MAPPDRIPDGTRLAEIPRRPVNEQFSAYVQSTTFSLSLGRTHIRALVRLDHALANDLPEARWPVAEDRAMDALERRGLIAWLTDDRRQMFRGEHARRWRDIIEITTAGKLVLLLLEEAGLSDPMERRKLPPPPPGYLDPRPKIVLTNEGVTVKPSDREAASRDFWQVAAT